MLKRAFFSPAGILLSCLISIVATMPLVPARGAGPGSIEDVLGGPKAPGLDSAAVIEPSPGPAGDPAQLLALRYWSNADYTRIVMDLDRPAPYNPPHLLNPDPALGTPPRLYIDFTGVVLSEGIKRELKREDDNCYHLPIGDGLLKKARAGQYKADVVRVVLDIERIDSFKAFPLPGDEFRYVIDVYGKPLPRRSPSPAVEPGPVTTRPSPANRGTDQRKLLIVLDAGHGGKDPGAVGQAGTREKDITLALAIRAASAIEKARPDVRVVLTRKDDRYLTLVERTALANTMNADLFLSIHCNAAPNKEAKGIETYYLDNTTDRAALKLAAKENFVSEEQMIAKNDTTSRILADMITSSKVEDSVPLAKYLQKSLVYHLKRKYSDTRDLGVKKAPFWVLTGATMPCALVEVNFLSNRAEEKLLRTGEYQAAAAFAIAQGVSDYLDNYHYVSMNRSK